MLANDTATMLEVLKSQIAAILYANRSNLEENYQNIIHSIFRLLGAEIHNDVLLNIGIIDAVIVNRDHIYIFEFKMDQPHKVAIPRLKKRAMTHPTSITANLLR